MLTCMLPMKKNVLTLKRPGYRAIYFARGGGADSAPPMKSMFPSIYRHVIHVITLFFHGDYDENVFFLIQSHQGGLERRERQPGGVQQEKLDVMFRRCDTSYNPIFYGIYNGMVFRMI